MNPLSQLHANPPASSSDSSGGLRPTPRGLMACVRQLGACLSCSTSTNPAVENFTASSRHSLPPLAQPISSVVEKPEPIVPVEQNDPVVSSSSSPVPRPAVSAVQLPTSIAVLDPSNVPNKWQVNPGEIRRVLVQAISSRQGLLEIIHPQERPFIRELYKDFLSGSIVSPWQVAPNYFVHGVEQIDSKGSVGSWLLHVGSPSARPQHLIRHVVPITDVSIPYLSDNPAAGNFYGCVYKVRQALETHLQKIPAASDSQVVDPCLLSHRSNSIPMVLWFSNQLQRVVERGEIQNLKQLAVNAEQLRNQLRSEFGRDVLSSEGFDVAVELAQTPMSGSMATSVSSNHAVEEDVILPATVEAYRQPAGDMHCGVTALNAYFQRSMLSCGDAITHLVGIYDEIYGIRQLELDGLLGGRLLNSVCRNQNLQISKQEFLGVNPCGEWKDLEAICRDLSPRDQWNTLLNFSYPEKIAVSADMRMQFKERISHLNITPGLWLTAFSGLNLDQLVALANDILSRYKDTPEMSSYPDRVEAYTVAQPAAQNQLALPKSIPLHRIEELLGTFKHRDNQGNQSPLPIVCMSGGGQTNSVNHYFGILRDSRNRWINLGSDGTTFAGVQPCAIFSEPGRLHEALAREKVFKIVCPCLSTVHKNFQSLEKQNAFSQ